MLSKPDTLTEALDVARAQEMSDKQAERIEIDQQSHGTDTNPKEKLYTLGQQAQAYSGTLSRLKSSKVA